jgi:cytochrome c oxidase subunit II
MSKIVKYSAVTGLAACLPFGAAFADWALNMPVGVTELSREIHGLHMLIFWICVVIAVAVFGMMIYSIISFRKSKGAIPANFDHSTKVEIIWTIIPIAILVGMAVPAADTLIKIEDTRDSQLSIEVTGYQWKWHYKYLNENVSFFSTLSRDSDRARQLNSGIDPFQVKNYLLDVDKPLVVPVGAKVRVLLTSNDVIHAWWVPAFGMKKDAIPGFVNELWFRADEPGIYRGQCAELCGRDHAFMPVVVEVLPRAEYDEWLKKAQAASGASAAPAAVAGVPSTTTPNAGSTLAKAE